MKMKMMKMMKMKMMKMNAIFDFTKGAHDLFAHNTHDNNDDDKMLVRVWLVG